MIKQGRVNKSILNAMIDAFFLVSKLENKSLAKTHICIK